MAELIIFSLLLLAFLVFLFLCSDEENKVPAGAFFVLSIIMVLLIGATLHQLGKISARKEYQKKVKIEVKKPVKLPENSANYRGVR